MSASQGGAPAPPAADELENVRASFTSECRATVKVDNNAGVLACWLPSGHDEPHFDEADQLYWQTAKEMQS